MIGFDPQLTTVILAACSGLALGVAGVRVVDATADRRMLARHRRLAHRMLRSQPADAPWSVPAFERPAPASTSFALPPGVRTAPPRVRVDGAVVSASPAVAKTESNPGPAVPHGQQNQAPPPLPRTLTGLPCSADAPTERVPRSEAVQLPAYLAMRALDAAPRAGYPGPHLQMRAIDHVTEFCAWQRDAHLGRNPKTGRWECRRTTADVLACYRQWAAARSLVTIPEWQFLNLLADQPGVEKKRERLKDRNGRVIRNANGSPDRTYYYTIFELPQVAAPVARRKVA